MRALVERLDVLREKATPGPWWTEPASDGRNGGNIYGKVRGGRPNGEGIIECRYYGHEHDSDANAALVSALVTAWPELRARLVESDTLIREAEAARDAAVEKVWELEDRYGPWGDVQEWLEANGGAAYRAFIGEDE
jgi:hypothetical protein